MTFSWSVIALGIALAVIGYQQYRLQQHELALADLAPCFRTLPRERADGLTWAERSRQSQVHLERAAKSPGQVCLPFLVFCVDSHLKSQSIQYRGVLALLAAFDLFPFDADILYNVIESYLGAGYATLALGELERVRRLLNAQQSSKTPAEYRVAADLADFAQVRGELDRLSKEIRTRAPDAAARRDAARRQRALTDFALPKPYTLLPFSTLVQQCN